MMYSLSTGIVKYAEPLHSLLQTMNTARQILGHLAVIDGVDTGLLHRLAPPGESKAHTRDVAAFSRCEH